MCCCWCWLCEAEDSEALRRELKLKPSAVVPLLVWVVLRVLQVLVWVILKWMLQSLPWQPAQWAAVTPAKQPPPPCLPKVTHSEAQRQQREQLLLH